MVGRLKLTSPGVLLILAVLAAGGIFLLDLFYLHPHVTTQKDAALRELAGRTAASGRLAMRSEGTELFSTCTAWAQNPVIARLLTDPDPHKRFWSFALREFDGENVDLAWLTTRTGQPHAAWSRSGGDSTPGALDDLRTSLKGAPADLSASETLPPYALLKISGNAILYARREIGRCEDSGQSRGHLWLGRTLHAATLDRIGTAIGGSLMLVGTDTIPSGSFADGSTTHALWPSGDDTLAVAWRACDATGKTLGYFRADVPAGHIRRQATTSRRMILIILSLSVAMVLLVILGTHMLVAGPVIRLVKRLQAFNPENAGIGELARDLHGEPLVLARRLESAFDRMAHMSQTDQLTGLANRRRFEEVLECFYHQARRYNRPLSLIIMDVDFFKAVNDTGGHQAGDELLQHISKTIEQACRKADLPARLGGDEFAVLLPETGIDDATAVAERIRTSVSEDEHTIGSVRMKVTASIGLTDLNTSGIDSDETMLALADRALYAAKDGGRNRVISTHELEGVHWSDRSEGSGKVSTLCKKLAGLDDQFKGLFLLAVEEIMEILEQRDPYMVDHARKVQHFAALTAREMELPDRVVTRIEIAAMLHDIGMVAMPDAVLLCPHELSQDNLQIMRKHPLYGVRIMEGMEFLEQEIPAVRHHHERYDGKGYPEGLSGGAIPLSARIVAVADVFDALTSPRAYRRAKTRAEAVDELRRVAGAQLDPTVVQAFMAVCSRLGDELMSLDDESADLPAAEPIAATDPT